MAAMPKHIGFCVPTSRKAVPDGPQEPSKEGLMEILAGIIIGMGLIVVIVTWAMRRELKKLENLT